MSSPMLRIMGLFDPTRRKEPISDIGVIKPGTVFQAPPVGLGQTQVPNIPPPPEISAAPPPMTPQAELAPPDYLAETTALFNQIYGQPDREIRDRLSGLLGNVPQRQDPSWFNRIHGMMAGFAGGPEAQERAMYPDYYRKMEDWKTQVGPLVQGANVERAEDINRRMMAAQISNAAYQGRKADVAEAAERRRLAASEAKIASDQERNAIARIRATMSSSDLKEGLDGYWYVIDKTTGREIRTNVKHLGWSEFEKENLRAETSRYRTDVMASRMDDPNRAENWTTLYEYDMNGVPQATYSYNEVTKETLPIRKPSGQQGGGFGPSPQSGDNLIAKPGFPPTQDRVSRQQRAGDIKRFFPEWDRFIQIDIDGNVAVRPPGTGRFDPSQAEWKMINDLLGNNEPLDKARERLLDPGALPLPGPPSAAPRRPPASTAPPQGAAPPTGPPVTPSTKSGWPAYNTTIGTPTKPPPGAKPGGTWIMLPGGRRAYKEP